MGFHAFQFVREIHPVEIVGNRAAGLGEVARFCPFHDHIVVIAQHVAFVLFTEFQNIIELIDGRRIDHALPCFTDGIGVKFFSAMIG